MIRWRILEAVQKIWSNVSASYSMVAGFVRRHPAYGRVRPARIAARDDAIRACSYR
jgi:hypothetical protein